MPEGSVIHHDNEGVLNDQENGITSYNDATEITVTFEGETAGYQTQRVTTKDLKTVIISRVLKLSMKTHHKLVAVVTLFQDKTSSASKLKKVKVSICS
ncbi:hypothetical protein O9992_27915 [Vibrio lentus]|nr:hypothetical protein [Vibrio lentus]